MKSYTVSCIFNLDEVLDINIKDALILIRPCLFIRRKFIRRPRRTTTLLVNITTIMHSIQLKIFMSALNYSACIGDQFVFPCTMSKISHFRDVNNTKL
jgi:hypothetical protein